MSYFRLKNSGTFKCFVTLGTIFQTLPAQKMKRIYAINLSVCLEQSQIMSVFLIHNLHFLLS